MRDLADNIIWHNPWIRAVREAERLINPGAVSQKKVREATGLTGTALVLYLVVSEGSRVIIPPRNLLPIP